MCKCPGGKCKNSALGGNERRGAIQYIQKKGIKHTKGQLNIKEDSNRGSEGQKTLGSI